MKPTVPLLIALILATALALDYVHVRLMCTWCSFPSPMFPVFVLLIAPTVLIFYFLYYHGFKPAEPKRPALAIITNLLKEPDRSIYIKVYEKGGEAFLSEVAKELGLRKLRAWRAAQRLAEKKLVALEKRAGRLVVRLLPLDDLSIKPKYDKHYKQYKQHK